MTKRLSYPAYWAQNGQVADPDLDTTNPSYLPNRYATIGWKAEKPPEEWQNFDTQITDLKIIELLADGIAEWDASVPYKSGAITKEAGILYRTIGGIGTTTNKQPSLNPNIWLKLMDNRTYDQYRDDVALIQKTLADHLKADNPHNIDIVRIGGVTSISFLKDLDDPTDSRTINYHKAQMGNVHSVTPAQAKTLPVAGGKFTGDVTFKKKIIFRDSAGFLQLDNSSARCDLTFAGFSLQIDAVGNAYVRSGGQDKLIITEANFVEQQNKINYMFTSGVPWFKFTLQYSLSDVESIGSWTLQSDEDAEFNAQGWGWNFKGMHVSATNFGFATNTAVTSYFSGSLADGTPFIRIFDTNMAQIINGFAGFLTAVSGPDVQFCKELRIYPRLSSYQKLSLAVV